MRDEFVAMADKDFYTHKCQGYIYGHRRAFYLDFRLLVVLMLEFRLLIDY